jgi:hypothetical protein
MFIFFLFVYEWAAYADIDKLDHGIFSHVRVIHAENFVDPNDHTQHIESLWKDVKRKLRNQCGKSENIFPSYLDEQVWRLNPLFATVLYTGHSNESVFCLTT